jgi:hypothetical protein
LDFVSSDHLRINSAGSRAIIARTPHDRAIWQRNYELGIEVLRTAQPINPWFSTSWLLASTDAVIPIRVIRVG